MGKEINASHHETHRKLVKGQNPFVPETDESSQSPEDGQSRKPMMEQESALGPPKSKKKDGRARVAAKGRRKP